VALQCVDIYIRVVWMGLGDGGGPNRLHKKALTFKGPVVQQTSVYRTGMHKIPPNLRHNLCYCFMGPSANLKISLRNPYRERSAVDS
jgi:hypothetical protein